MARQHTYDDPLAVARESIDVLAESILLLQHHTLSEPNILQIIAKRIASTLVTKNTIHISGMGRSRLVGNFFSELLLDQNMSASLIGSTYAKPVRNGDIVIGISGSGTTKTTVSHVMATTMREVFITAITSRRKSSLARFADESIIFDWTSRERTQTNYVYNQLTGKRASLTPMGTLFEFTSLIFLIALAKTVRDYQDIEKNMKEILTYSYNAMINLEKQLLPKGKLYESVYAFLQNLKDDRRNDRQIYWHGTDLSALIATMVGMRAQHASMRMRPITSWRFRKQKDHIMVIAPDPQDLLKAETRLSEAQNNPRLHTTVITMSKPNNIPLEIDHFIPLSYTSPKNEFIKEEDPYKRSLSSLVFLATSSALMDSLIAQLAFDLGIAETEMSQMHANVE